MFLGHLTIYRKRIILFRLKEVSRSHMEDRKEIGVGAVKRGDDQQRRWGVDC